jgi:hypothetical protein
MPLPHYYGYFIVTHGYYITLFITILIILHFIYIIDIAITSIRLFHFIIAILIFHYAVDCLLLITLPAIIRHYAAITRAISPLSLLLISLLLAIDTPLIAISHY